MRRDQEWVTNANFKLIEKGEIFQYLGSPSGVGVNTKQGTVVPKVDQRQVQEVCRKDVVLAGKAHSCQTRPRVNGGVHLLSNPVCEKQSGKDREADQGFCVGRLMSCNRLANSDNSQRSGWPWARESQMQN